MPTERQINAALAAWDSIPKHKDLSGRLRMAAAIEAADQATWRPIAEAEAGTEVLISQPGDDYVEPILVGGKEWRCYGPMIGKLKFRLMPTPPGREGG